MPICYQLVGVPASGKSTWVSNQLWAKDCAYISTDLHVETHARSVNKTYSEVFNDFMPVAVDLMCEDVIAAREQNRDIIWDQTSTSVKSRKRKFNMLPHYDHIAVVFKTPDSSELLKRLATRPGKEIPWKVIDDMINGFEFPTQDEGFKEIWWA